MKNKEKGITLIALIITIIVMLILVGVTINIDLNGGLFQKAKSAADGTQKQAEKEELMAAAFGTVDTKGDLQIKKSALESVLSQGWEIDDENTITDSNNQKWYPCTSPKGNIYYLNAKTGEIVDKKPSGNIGNLIPTPNELAGTYFVVGNPPERQGSLTIDFDINSQLILNNNSEDALPPEYYTITENSIIITPPEGEEMVFPCFKTSNTGIVFIMNGIVFAKNGTTNFFTSNLSSDFSGKTYAADLNAYDDAEKIVFGSTSFDLYTEEKGDWSNENILHGTCGMLGNNVLIILNSSDLHGTYNARLLTPSNGNATLTSETNLGDGNIDVYYIYNLSNE